MENNNTAANITYLLKNFRKAFSDLAEAWVDLQCSELSDKYDFSKNYPFNASFDDLAVKKWIETCLAQLSAKDSSFFGLVGNRQYKTKFVQTTEQANQYCLYFPEYGVLAETPDGIHLALISDTGTPVSDAVKYLKEVYGLNPEDVELKDSDTVEDVNRIAAKYNLTRKSDMTLEKAKQILKPFTSK